MHHHEIKFDFVIVYLSVDLIPRMLFLQRMWMHKANSSFFPWRLQPLLHTCSGTS